MPGPGSRLRLPHRGRPLKSPASSGPGLWNFSASSSAQLVLRNQFSAIWPPWNGVADTHPGAVLPSSSAASCTINRHQRVHATHPFRCRTDRIYRQRQIAAIVRSLPGSSSAQTFTAGLRLGERFDPEESIRARSTNLTPTDFNPTDGTRSAS